MRSSFYCISVNLIVNLTASSRVVLNFFSYACVKKIISQHKPLTCFTFKMHCYAFLLGGIYDYTFNSISI